MAFQVGDRVVAESESTDRAPRTGTALEVLRGDPSPRYRIEWDDGHTTIYTPAAARCTQLASEPAQRADEGRRVVRSPVNDAPPSQHRHEQHE